MSPSREPSSPRAGRLGVLLGLLQHRTELLLFSKYLMGRSVFLRLDDVAEGLPSFDEGVVQVPLGKLEAPYRTLGRTVAGAVKAELARGSKKLPGLMIRSLVTWPDHPFKCRPLVQKEPGKIIARPASLNTKITTPKEKKLVEIVKAELAQDASHGRFAPARTGM